MVAAQTLTAKGWCKASYDQTTSLFFIEKFTFAVWKVALSPTDNDQKYLTDSESLSLNIQATCLLPLSPRNFPYEIKKDGYRPWPSMISMFTFDSQHPPRSRHAVYLGAYGQNISGYSLPKLTLDWLIFAKIFVIFVCFRGVLRHWSRFYREYGDNVNSLMQMVWMSSG